MNTLLPPIDYTLTLLTVTLIVYMIVYIMYFIHVIKARDYREALVLTHILSFNTIVLIAIVSLLFRNPYLVFATIPISISIYLSRVILWRHGG